MIGQCSPRTVGISLASVRGMENLQRKAGGIGRRTLVKAASIAAGSIVLGAPDLAEAAGIPSGRLIPMNDRNIRYRGRWQEQSNGDVHGYYQSGLELDFTGTSISLTLAGSCRLLYRVDCGAVQRNLSASGTLTLASGLSQGPHAVQVYSEYQQSFPKLKYFEIDHGASPKPGIKRPAMEFVGDSISVGYIGPGLVNSLGSSFTFKTPELLGFSHNTVAFGGIAVAAGSGAPDSSGMVSRYTKLSEYVPGEANVPEWDTSRYVPDHVVVNLGTNDPSTGVRAPNFKPAYLTFLEQLRSYYPGAVIFAMSPLNTAHRSEIAETVCTRKAAGDANVAFVDTTGWIDTATETTDGTHPTIAAHDKVAAKLAPWIQDYLAGRR